MTNLEYYGIKNLRFESWSYFIRDELPQEHVIVEIYYKPKHARGKKIKLKSLPCLPEEAAYVKACWLLAEHHYFLVEED